MTTGPSGSFLKQYATASTLQWEKITYAEGGVAVWSNYMRARITAHAGRRSQLAMAAHQSDGPLAFAGHPVGCSLVQPAGRRRVERPGGHAGVCPGPYDAIRARALSVASPIEQLTGPSDQLVLDGVR
jgi:hypothetical protein